jgi:hypothetical protein
MKSIWKMKLVVLIYFLSVAPFAGQALEVEEVWQRGELSDLRHLRAAMVFTNIEKIRVAWMVEGTFWERYLTSNEVSQVAILSRDFRLQAKKLGNFRTEPISSTICIHTKTDGMIEIRIAKSMRRFVTFNSPYERTIKCFKQKRGRKFLETLRSQPGGRLIEFGSTPPIFPPRSN